MKLRLADIPIDIRERVGEALYVAQRLEWCLVCHLLVRRNRGVSVVTAEMIDSIESECERMTLGQLIRELDVLTGSDPASENTLTRALKYRNHIAHQFYKMYGDTNDNREQCRVMRVRLDIMILEMRSAVDLMQHWTEGLAFAFKVDIEAIRKDYDARLLLLANG
jgi:hypothetical protein